jgi:TolB-like protein
VLPFQNMSGDPEQEYFADGMVEDIITALSRIRWLFVIARNSTFTYKGQAVDVKQVARELGVRYVLEGSVRRAGNRVRITGQLIDAINGAHLWADRFDGALEDVFDLQDKVALSVAGVIEPTLQAAETSRSTGRPTADLTAYDLYLRAYAMTLSSTKEIPEALRLLEQAIYREPHYGAALAWAAHCCIRLVTDGRSEDPAADRLKGADFARRALRVAGDDPVILANVALALAGFGEDIGAMIALIDLGGPARRRDRARRKLTASQSPRPHRHVAHRTGRSSFPQLPVRRGSAETAPGDPGGSEFSAVISLSCRVLCAYGPARRGARDCRSAAHCHVGRNAGRQLPAEGRAPRTLLVRLTLGYGRGDMSQSHRLPGDARPGRLHTRGKARASSRKECVSDTMICAALSASAGMWSQARHTRQPIRIIGCLGTPGTETER